MICCFLIPNMLENVHILTENLLSFLMSEVLLTLYQGPIPFLTCISSTFKHSHKMTNLFNQYSNFHFTLNKAPLGAALFLSYWAFPLFGISCLSFFFISIQYTFTLLVLSLYHHPFVVFLTSPHIYLSFLLLFVDEAVIRSRHHAQALFFASPVRWWGRQQTSNVPSWHLTPRVCVTMLLLGFWVFHPSRSLSLPQHLLCLPLLFSPSILCVSCLKTVLTPWVIF